MADEISKPAPQDPPDLKNPADQADISSSPSSANRAVDSIASRVKLLVFCGAIAFFAATLLNIGMGLWWSGAITAVLFFLTAAALFFYDGLTRRVSAALVGHITLAMCSLAICVIAYGEGTTRSPNLHFLSAIVVASALLFGVLASRVWTAISIVAEVITFTVDVLFGKAQAKDALNHSIGLVVVLLLLHLLASAASRVANASIEASKKATEQARKSASDLAEANASLGAAVQTRTRFLANMSHEIRTPLNAVLGFTDVLLRTPLDKNQLQSVETIRTAGQGLLVVIDDVLQFSRIEDGKLTLASERVNVMTIADESAEMSAVSAHKGGLEIWVDVRPDAPVLVLADAARVRQVVLNLLTNSVKFTNQGEVIVRIKKAEVPSFCRIEVIDTGMGISPEAAQNLFQPFAPGDSSTKRRHGGSGLGLVISKRLVDAMGGRIGFSSEVGKGSCFWFELPAIGRPNHTFPDILGTKVLVFAGQKRHSEHLARHLSGHIKEGVALIETGATTAEIENLLDSAPQTIAIVDVDPAKAPPSEFVSRLLRDHPRLRGVLLLRPFSDTNSLQFETLPPCTRAMHKPVRTLRLLAEVSALGSGSDSQAQLAPLVDSLKPFFHHVLLVEDNIVNQKVAKAMLESLGCTVEIASTGQEAQTLSRGANADLVLMDLHMPDMDGFDATRAIRAEEQLAGRERVPIFALTASVLPEDQEECLNVGMNGHLAKPLDPKHLIELLRSIPARDVRQSHLRDLRHEKTRGA